MIHYRNDIDGLRAIAIVPVVLFHADVFGFGGGYLGVDIFFVISGYLITRQLLDSQANGWKLIAEFYERRVRRIAPAFIAMLAILLLAVTALFPAADVLRTAKSAVSALLFAANIRFYGKTGYFDSAADDEPLLHTWSLAVEEQFYLFFPLLLLLIRRWRTVPALAILALASLALAQLSVSKDPAWAFYLLPARAWELLAGALLTASGIGGGIRPVYRETLAAVGLAFVAVPIFTYDTFTPVPGLATLPPVIGAVLLLAIGEGTTTGRLLSLRPLVWIGLISFSLYLWHWPIFVVTRQLSGSPDGLTTAGLILASLVISFLSYRYVERPFRNRALFSRARVLILSAGAALAIAAGCAALIALHGLPSRSPAAERFFQATAETQALFQASPCLVQDVALPPLAPCMLGARGPHIDGIIWGDSHASHWRPMVDTAAAKAGLTFRQVTKGGCPPVPADTMYPHDPLRSGCPQFNAEVKRYVLERANIRYIVLAANWQGITEGTIRLGSAGSAMNFADSRKAAKDALERLAGELRRHGKTVLIIGQTPLPDRNVIQCMTRQLYLHLDGAICTRSSFDLAYRREQAASDLFAGAVANGARILSPFGHFCDRNSCIAVQGSKLLYIDGHHLSVSGAHRLDADLLKRLSGPR